MHRWPAVLTVLAAHLAAKLQSMASGRCAEASTTSIRSALLLYWLTCLLLRLGQQVMTMQLTPEQRTAAASAGSMSSSHSVAQHLAGDAHQQAQPALPGLRAAAGG